MIIRLYFKKIIQKCGKDYIWNMKKNKIPPENNQLCEEGQENRNKEKWRKKARI